MENKNSSDNGKLGRPEYEITGNSNQLSSSQSSLSYHQSFDADDILLADFPEEEIFVLSENYVLMEGEYVMWEESSTSKEKVYKRDYEDQLMLPLEDSLHSLGEYFTLNKVNRPISHN